MIGVGRSGPLGLLADADVAGREPIRPGSPASPVGGARPAGTAEHEALAILATVAGLGPVTLGRLLVAFDSARGVLDVARASEAAPALIRGSRDPDGVGHAMSAPVAEAIVATARDSDAVLRRLVSAGVRFVTIDDDAYPSRLRAIEVPPHVLTDQERSIGRHCAELVDDGATLQIGIGAPAASGGC